MSFFQACSSLSLSSPFFSSSFRWICQFGDCILCIYILYYHYFTSFSFLICHFLYCATKKYAMSVFSTLDPECQLLKPNHHILKPPCCVLNRTFRDRRRLKERSEQCRGRHKDLAYFDFLSLPLIILTKGSDPKMFRIAEMTLKKHLENKKRAKRQKCHM